MKLRAALIPVAFAALAAAMPAAAQFKPSRPVEFVTHTGPGGGGDLLARFIAGAVEKESLSPVRMTINNKTGGGGLTAMSYMLEKKGEPHMIGVFTSLWITTPLMRSEAKFGLTDLTPIVRLVKEPAVIAVKADSPIKTLKDFIDAAKAKPGEMKQSGGSIGSRDWLVRQVLMKNTGANWAFISFPGGGERIAALLGGHVNLMVIDAQESSEQVRAGTLRIIAQLGDKRLPSYPNIPTLKEAGFDVVDVPQVRGIVGPPGMAPEVVRYWEDLFEKFVQTGSWKRYLEENQFESAFQRSGDLAKFMVEYNNMMRNVLIEGGVKVAR